MKSPQISMLLLAIMTGCAKEQQSLAKVNPISPPVVQDGIHPRLTKWAYATSSKKYNCKNDPYSCKECPVGKPDRVIHAPHGPYTDVPDFINVWFLCDDINRLLPPKGLADSDSFICSREPADGSVEYRGKIYSCGPIHKDDQRIDLGTLEPGESKTIEIEVKP